MGALLNRRRYMGGAKATKPYLKFTALEDGTFQFVKALEYSLDGGNTWVSLAANTPTPTIQTGDSILWKGQFSPGNAKNNFTSTGRFSAEGDVRSVVYGDNWESATPTHHCAYNMFRDCTTIIDARGLILPEFPSTATESYSRLFMGATSLMYAPTNLPLPLSTRCFSEMFRGCSSLITIPSFPSVSQIPQYGYEAMFYGCSSLTTAPALPATEIANGAYSQMFYGCSSLVNAPSLPATTIGSGCYQEMFYNCTSLESSPAILPAMTLQKDCYRAMFYGCSNLLTTPVLPAETLAVSCYRALFQYCSKVNYIKAMFTSDPASVNGCLTNWVSQVASSGTFVKNSLSTFDTRGINGIPNNWTIETADS